MKKIIVENMKIEIRQAEISDLVVLKKFEQEIIRFERHFDPNLRKDPIEYYDIVNLIKREDAMMLVATINSEIVGSGYALTKNNQTFYKNSEYAYLGFMYVLPEYRRRGVNGKIIDRLISWSRNRGLTEVQLNVYSENISAINAYKKKKFKPSGLNMILNTVE
ncbi:GNAT family N-acetyltransferase [Psychroserpens sp.]|uniref:GNAT family N-acetyltransferase n=1 Tax=Psychroserpens sp. TaxID=2020870 RepID=UPI00300231C5